MGFIHKIDIWFGGEDDDGRSGRNDGEPYRARAGGSQPRGGARRSSWCRGRSAPAFRGQPLDFASGRPAGRARRSDTRRVGKECVSSAELRWSPDHFKKIDPTCTKSNTKK